MNQIRTEKEDLRECYVCEGLFNHTDLYYDTIDNGVIGFCESCHKRHKKLWDKVRKWNKKVSA